MDNVDLFWKRVNYRHPKGWHLSCRFSVKELIKTHDTKQETVAVNCDISYRTFQTWINRKTYPNAEQTFKIAKELNTSVEYLMTGELDIIDKDIKEVEIALQKLPMDIRKPIIISALAQVKAMQELFNEKKEEGLKNGTAGNA